MTKCDEMIFQQSVNYDENYFKRIESLFYAAPKSVNYAEIHYFKTIPILRQSDFFNAAYF